VSDALEIQQLNVHYGVLHALQDVSLRVPSGSVVALIGANGAGKSSTLNAIAGTVASTSGAMRAGNAAIAGLAPRDRIMKHGVVLVPEGRSVFATMTVRENLELGARVGARRLRANRALPRFDMGDVATLFPVLRERANRRAEYLSGGERQMLAMARALLMAPSLLLVDEPSMGLAPLAVRDLFGILREVFVKAGVAVLLVEQDTRLALDVAGYAYLLQRGVIVAHGQADELRDDPRIRAAYLGDHAVVA
jgi:branched-chain amino acid transport system ATP-binding protein